MNEVQRGFAVLLRSRTLTVRGLTQDAHALLQVAQSQFPDEAKDPAESPTRAIRFMLYTTWGNVYREDGQVEKAHKHYDHAAKYVADSSELFTLKRKKFNAYLLADKAPPDEWVKDLDLALREGIYDDRTNEKVRLHPAEYAYTCYALAWHYRNSGLSQLETALEYNQAGILHLTAPGTLMEMDCQLALNAGRLYLADKLMRNGQFERANREARESKYAAIHQLRLATRTYLSGRALAYQALSTGEIRLLDKAIEELEEADISFSMMGISQRRLQSLTCLSKFYATRAALLGSKRYEVEDFRKAGNAIELARTIYDALDTSKLFDGWAVQINSLVIQFLSWISVPGQRVDKETSRNLERSIRGLGRELEQRGMAGHQARVYALSAAMALVRMTSTIVPEELREDRILQRRVESPDAWQESVTRDIHHSAGCAIKWDMMALYDCRWYISLGAEKSIYPSRFDLVDALAEFDEYSGNRIAQAPIGSWAGKA